ncbi:MAG: hypothetical protein ACREDR_37020 [Blastocatellia bacterium]
MLKTIENKRRTGLWAVVVLAGLAGLLAVVVKAQEEPQGEESYHHRDPIVGTWRLEVFPDGGLPDGRTSFIQFQNYNADGTIVAFDNASPSTQETGSVGPWKHISEGKYVEDDYQLVSEIDANGNVINPTDVCTFVVHAISFLDPKDPNKFTGPYSFTQTCPDIPPITGQGTANGYKLYVK